MDAHSAAAQHPPDETAHDRLIRLVELGCAHSRAEHRIHTHQESRTMEDARRDLHLEVERIVKTVAFQTRGGLVVLAALRGTLRVDYARLAAVLGVNRRDLRALAPEEVRLKLGVEPGAVSPVCPLAGVVAVVDEDVLSMAPTAYCGIGRADRTLELAPAELVRLAGGRTGRFSR